MRKFGWSRNQSLPNYGFNSRELARILRVIIGHRDLILRAWHEHFGDGSSI